MGSTSIAYSCMPNMEQTARIREKLNELKGYAEILKKQAPASKEELVDDFQTRWAVEHGLQIISEAELDACALLFKHLGGMMKGDDISILEAVSSKLGKEVTASVKKRRDLRNKIVHEYTDNSFLEEVFRESRDLEDVSKFIAKVTQLIE